jgi:hypothetical protein
MRNLRERAQLTGGTFELAAGSPQGAVAQVSWVLSPDEAAASSTEIGGGTLT